MPTTKLTIFLSTYYVYLLELNFFLLIIAFIFNFKYIKEILAEAGNKCLLLLILIAIIGTSATAFINPKKHRIYYDEDIYNSIAQCIASHKRAVMCNEGYYENNELNVVAEEYNKQPSGYPYLIHVIFRIFGTNERFTFILNNIIFGLTVFVIFLITFLLFKDTFAGLAASLAYILIPINLQWFNTCAAEPLTAFFASLAILSSLIYLRNKKPINLFLFTTVLAFSLNFRMESFLIIISIGLIYLLKGIDVFKKKELYLFGGLLLLLSTGIILHVYASRGQSWGADGAKFSLDYFHNNFNVNSMFYLNNKEFPLLFSILAIAGLFFYKNRNYIKEKIIILSWFITFWGIFLFFYAGNYKFGEDLSARFSILSYAPISIFAGLGSSLIKTRLENKIRPIKLVLISLIIFNFTWFLPFIRTESKGESEQCRIDRKYAMEFIKLLPENSIILTHNPNMFLINKQSAIQTSSETYNPGTIERLRERFKGGVYVHYNYWSNVSYSKIQRDFTENILNKYDYEILEEYYYKSYKYGLYKITGLRENK
jgi:hypothetical protein